MAIFGRLSPQRITGQLGPPAVVVPPWTVAAVALLVVPVLVVTHLEWRRLRRVSLAALLRGGRSE